MASHATTATATGSEPTTGVDFEWFKKFIAVCMHPMPDGKCNDFLCKLSRAVHENKWAKLKDDGLCTTKMAFEPTGPQHKRRRDRAFTTYESFVALMRTHLGAKETTTFPPGTDSKAQKDAYQGTRTWTINQKFAEDKRKQDRLEKQAKEQTRLNKNAQRDQTRREKQAKKEQAAAASRRKNRREHMFNKITSQNDRRKAAKQRPTPKAVTKDRGKDRTADARTLKTKSAYQVVSDDDPMGASDSDSSSSGSSNAGVPPPAEGVGTALDSASDSKVTEGASATQPGEGAGSAPAFPESDYLKTMPSPRRDRAAAAGAGAEGNSVCECGFEYPTSDPLCAVCGRVPDAEVLMGVCGIDFDCDDDLYARYRHLTRAMPAPVL